MESVWKVRMKGESKMTIKLVTILAVCTGGAALALDDTQKQGADRTRTAPEIQRIIDQCGITLADAIRTADRESGGKCFSAKLVDWQTVQGKIDRAKVKNRDVHSGHPVAKVCSINNGKMIKSLVCCKTNEVLDRRDVSDHAFGFESQDSSSTGGSPLVDMNQGQNSDQNPLPSQTNQSSSFTPGGQTNPADPNRSHTHRDAAKKDPAEIQRRIDVSNITATEAISIAERETSGKCAFVEITDWQCVQSSVDSSKVKNRSISSDEPIARVVCIKDGRKLESIVCGKTKQVIDTHECGTKSAQAPAQTELAQPVVTP